jgi:hypothetical protein
MPYKDPYNKRILLINMYFHMKNRHSVAFTLKEFKDRYLEDPRFNRLHQEWIRKGRPRSLVPSLDRINSKKGYTFENTHMLTWEENRFKQTLDTRFTRRAVLQILDGKVIKRYRSQRDVVKDLGVSQWNLSTALNGGRHKVGGYMFQYEDDQAVRMVRGLA